MHKFRIGQRVNILNRQEEVVKRGTILRHDGVDGENPAYAIVLDGDEIDRIIWENFLAPAADTECECCKGMGFSLFAMPDFPKVEHYLDVEKCDMCEVFDSDEDAMIVAKTLGLNVVFLNRDSGEPCREIDGDTVFAVSVEEYESSPLFS